MQPFPFSSNSGLKLIAAAFGLRHPNLPFGAGFILCLFNKKAGRGPLPGNPR
jgi:hypothetical protein